MIHFTIPLIHCYISGKCKHYNLHQKFVNIKMQVYYMINLLSCIVNITYPGGYFVGFFWGGVGVGWGWDSFFSGFLVIFKFCEK